MALILDTGPLYASLDRSDAHHLSCRKLIEGATDVLVIPAPVMVEIDYLVHSRMHAGVFVALLDDITAKAYEIENLTTEDYRRVREICDRYGDSDVGFVDAAVLAIVERLNEPRLATLDHRHFGMLKPRHVDALELVPG
ncbi:MAG: PIN domain-containing protein [Longimicrobiales bacterium]